MSLPTNNSRPIIINNVPCRWTVSGSIKDPYLTIIVQSEDSGKLSIKVHQEIKGWVWLYDSNGKSHHGSITPKWIQELSKMSKNKGWKPGTQESFSFRFEQGNLVLI